MKYISAISFFVIISLASNIAEAQRHEYGLLLGGTYYLGDLNPNKHFAMTNLGGGLMYRRNFTEHFSLRINGLYGNVQADDAIIGYNSERNLRFQSSIIELSTQAEINFVPFIVGHAGSPYSFYLFFGAGAFRFEPKATYNGQLVDLRPLRTEGQGSELYPDREVYSLYSYNLLFGIGMKLHISKSISVGLEWGMRRTGTDYLDDVSASYPDPNALNSDLAASMSDRSQGQVYLPGMNRGNPYNNDWYSFLGITLSVRIKDSEKLLCPVYD